MIYIPRFSGENNEHIIRRFKKEVRGARFIVKLKQERYRRKKATKRQVRNAAIVAAKYRTARKKQMYIA